MYEPNCPHCGTHVHRTHHCRAFLPADPPTPLDRTTFDRIRAQARLEAQVEYVPLPLDDPQLLIINDEAWLDEARAQSNRGGRP